MSVLHSAKELVVYKKAFELLKDKATVPDGIESMALIYATDPAYAKKLRAAYDQALQKGILYWNIH